MHLGILRFIRGVFKFEQKLLEETRQDSCKKLQHAFAVESILQSTLISAQKSGNPAMNVRSLRKLLACDASKVPIATSLSQQQDLLSQKLGLLKERSQFYFSSVSVLLAFFKRSKAFLCLQKPR